MNSRSTDIVVVSGLPRSGTSLVMRMLSHGGMSTLTDQVRPADASNPYGYFEHSAVKSLAADPLWLEVARGKVVKIVAPLIAALPPSLSYRVVFLLRDLRDVAYSQMAMVVARGGTRIDSLDRWIELLRDQRATTLAWLEEAKNVELLTLELASIIREPLETARKLHHFAGCRASPESMAQAIEPALCHHRHWEREIDR